MIIMDGTRHQHARGAAGWEYVLGVIRARPASVTTSHHVHNLYRVRFDYKLKKGRNSKQEREWKFGHRLSDWAHEIFWRRDATGNREDDEPGRKQQGQRKPHKQRLLPECDNKYCEQRWKKLEREWEKLNTEERESRQEKMDDVRIYCYVCNCKGCWDDRLKDQYTGGARRGIARSFDRLMARGDRLRPPVPQARGAHAA
jgi:hypothetical protein